MIISKNNNASADDFEKILSKSVANISAKADENNSYFQKRNFSEFEEDVYETVTEASVATEFEDSIELISGQKFPDIVAKQYYGIEVKSSLGGNWKGTGNSVLESTRIENVERIYLFFGQLSRPAQFKYRLYQECLFDVAVTHSPRYLIDMQLEPGNSIFDRIGIDYNDLRKKENPIAPIVDYYRKHSKKGEEPWWMGSPDDVVPVKVKLWGDLTSERKRELEVQSMARFPEIFSKGFIYHLFSTVFPKKDIPDCVKEGMRAYMR